MIAIDHRTGCTLQHKSVLACLCSSHIFDIGHWKSVLILAEEQDQMRPWEALLSSVKGLGSCRLRNKTEWSCLKPWYWALEFHSCQLKFKAEWGCGKALILGMRSVFMSPEEQDRMKPFHVTWGTRLNEAVSRHLRNETNWGYGKPSYWAWEVCLSPEVQDRMRLWEALILGMRGLCSHCLSNKTEWSCLKPWYWALEVCLSPEVQDWMRLWESFDIGHEVCVHVAGGTRLNEAVWSRHWAWKLCVHVTWGTRPNEVVWSWHWAWKLCAHVSWGTRPNEAVWSRHWAWKLCAHVSWGTRPNEAVWSRHWAWKLCAHVSWGTRPNEDVGSHSASCDTGWHFLQLSPINSYKCKTVYCPCLNHTQKFVSYLQMTCEMTVIL